MAFGNDSQVSPIFVNVQVRPQQSVTFDLQVQPASNFPIDLYLLMDLSGSMRDDLANLQQLAFNLGTDHIMLKLLDNSSTVLSFSFSYRKTI